MVCVKDHLVPAVLLYCNISLLLSLQKTLPCCLMPVSLVHVPIIPTGGTVAIFVVCEFYSPYLHSVFVAMCTVGNLGSESGEAAQLHLFACQSLHSLTVHHSLTH